MGEAIRTWKEGLSTKPEGIRKIYKNHLDRFLEANGFELNRAEDLHLGRYDDFQALPKQVRKKIERSRRDWIIPY